MLENSYLWVQAPDNAIRISCHATDAKFTTLRASMLGCIPRSNRRLGLLLFQSRPRPYTFPNAIRQKKHFQQQKIPKYFPTHTDILIILLTCQYHPVVLIPRVEQQPYSHTLAPGQMMASAHRSHRMACRNGWIFRDRPSSH